MLETTAPNALPVISSVAAAVAAYYYFKPKAISRGHREIPSPKSGRVPFFGHLFAMDELPALKVSEWHKECNSPIIKIMMGSQPWVSVNDPEVAHKLFFKNGNKTSGRATGSYGSDIYSCGRGVVFADDTKKWNKTRAAAKLILDPKMVDKYSSISRSEVDIMIDSLVTQTKENEEGVDPADTILLNALNVILKTCYDKRVESTDDALFKRLMYLLDTGMKYVGSMGYIAAFVPSLWWVDKIQQKTQEMRKFVAEHRDELLNQLIKEAREQPNPCLVKELYGMKSGDEDEDRFNLDDQDILVTLSDLFFAGSDTVSVAIAWMFAYLANHPDAQQKIISEVDAFIAKHNRLPTFAERDHFPYLNSVQRECLRLRPSVPFTIPHRATDDLFFEGYFIPKDTILLANSVSMHLNPAVYKDEPEKFKGDRFLGKNQTMTDVGNGKIEDRDIYVFGWGRRICPGSYLAETELFNAYVQLFARCTIEPALKQGKPEFPNVENIVDKGATCPPGPYKVRVVERTDRLL